MPDVSRRAVLAASGLATAVVALAAPASAAAARVPLRAEFAALRGRRLRLSGPHGAVRVMVADVEGLSDAGRQDSRRYSVLLRPSRPVPDGIYRLSSSRFASADLFLANVDRRGAAGLEAVVNVA